jgi:hypothetical protein
MVPSKNFKLYFSKVHGYVVNTNIIDHGTLTEGKCSLPLTSCKEIKM